MNAPRDLDSIVNAWLEEGPTRLPDQTRRSIVVALPTTSQQRRAMRVPWRFPPMSTIPKLAVGAVVVIAVLLGGAFLLRSGPIRHRSRRRPDRLAVAVARRHRSPFRLSPSPSSGARRAARYDELDSHTPRLDTGSASAIRSIGRSIPSDRAWVFPADTTCCPPRAPRRSFPRRVTSACRPGPPAITKGESLDAWIQAYCQTIEPRFAVHRSPGLDRPGDPRRPCRPTHPVHERHAGLLPRRRQGVYIVACWRPEDDGSVAPYGGARRLLEGYLSTMRLLPGGPASPAPSRPS